MRKNNNYTINFETRTITITKKFGKEASEFGTKAFEIMKQLREEFPDFQIAYKTIQKKENKESFKGLTLVEMERFIAERSDEELEYFKKVVEVADCRQGKYAIIKKWFLDNYKEEYKAELTNITPKKVDLSAKPERKTTDVEDVLANMKAPKQAVSTAEENEEVNFAEAM